MTSFQRKSIKINSLLLAYYEAVPKGKSKKTLLFLHGWGSNSTLWFKTIGPLSEKGYTMYCLDLPGFGNSQNPQSSFFLQDYSYAVMEFIEKLELIDVVLIGHSFGGKTAIKLAAENPEFLKSLV